ncbi:pyruvate dehydrogenase complex dihydrolipoamide acetyltransferase [Leifsonia bigeumensis]|uniref:Dihydrolipoamide acetyltransferase component of pyruvate dehydrogenase complex n=1 Tax=Leifsonella bigeumensis TaxID=433643 RepID=A0ABP7F9V6_9MICO
MALVIRMPEVLTGATEAALQSWLVAVGDTIAIGQPIAEVETEKATVEYEAEAAGTVAELLIETGVQVEVGTPIAVLATDGETVAAALASASAQAPQATAAPVASRPTEQADAPVVAAPVPTPAPLPAAAPMPVPAAASAPASPASGARLFMSPLVRRLAAERGLDLTDVTGSGPGGRIVRRDLDAMSAAAATARPTTTAVATAGAGFTDTPHTGMRRAIARRLVESKTTIPHFYLVADCRVEALLELRKAVNENISTKISVNDFVVKAVAAAFRDVPDANAIWTDEGTRRFDDVDIAIAVAIEGGLVTPVVRGVNRRSLGDVSESIRELAERGRAGRLRQDEIEGGSFSVSNLGMYGTQEFSAIINPPHSGILAVGAARKMPIVVDDELQIGTVMTVTLSADHRVLDGALAAQWLAAFVARIENPVSILV